jgi:hypothetical protein
LSVKHEVFGCTNDKGGMAHPTHQYFGLAGLVKSHHTTIQALFGRYLISPLLSRPAIVNEILVRLQSDLAIEDEILLSVIRNSGPQGPDLIESTILEYEDIQAMFQEFKADIEGGERWGEMFEDMMQTVRVHFITEERDLLPLVDRSRDA